VHYLRLHQLFGVKPIYNRMQYDPK
jgi:hypothetical protein